MFDVRVVFVQVSVIFLLMILGISLRKLKILSLHSSKQISNLILTVTLPCLMIISFQVEFTDQIMENGLKLFGIALFIHLISAILGKILFFRYKGDKKSILRFAIVFSNPAFMGFPIMQSLYGSMGLFYCSIYVMVFNLFFWTYGMVILGEGKKEKIYHQLLFNPGVLAIFIGTVLFYFSISLPEPIYDALNMVGQTTTPLAMMILGFILGGVRVKNFFSDFSIYYVSLLRLILLPLLFYYFLIQFDFDQTLVGVSVLATAMPVSVSGTMLAQKYQRSPELASVYVLVSTSLSLGTIPLLAFLL